METIKIGKWEIPDELFERYLRLVNATERSSKRYNYDFDERRQSVHQEICDFVGLRVHMKDYREFQRALQNLCNEMLPSRIPTQLKITKLDTPFKGMLSR